MFLLISALYGPYSYASRGYLKWSQLLDVRDGLCNVRRTDHGIAIIRVLHERMDAPGLEASDDILQRGGYLQAVNGEDLVAGPHSGW